MKFSVKMIVLLVALFANLACGSAHKKMADYLNGVVEINNSISQAIEVSGAASYKRLELNRGKSAYLQSQALRADRDQWIQDRADLEVNKKRAEALEVPEEAADLQSKFLVFIEAYDQRLQSRIEQAERQLKDGRPPDAEAQAEIAKENQALLEKYNAFDSALKKLGESSGIAVN